MAPPLLSEHKRAFAGKRLCQNVLGGPRLFAVPFPFILIQICLFCLPIALLSSLDAAMGGGKPFWAVPIFALALFLLDLTLTLFILLLSRGRNSVRPRTHSDGRNFLTEEDLVSYEGFLAPSTWAFVTPNVSFSLSHAAALIMSTLTFALSVPLLLKPSNSISLRLIGLFVLCNSRFSAVLSVPPEIATFDTDQRKSALHRPFYAALSTLLHILITQCAEWESVAGDACLLYLALLPLGWGFGFLPPLDALFPWLLEAVLVALGGCPSLCYFGSLLGLLLAILYILLVFIVGSMEVVDTALQCAFGYFILLDAGTFLSFTQTSVVGLFKVRKKHRLLANWASFVCSLSLVVLALCLPLEKETCGWAFLGATAAFAAVLHIIQTTFARKGLRASAVWMHWTLQKILTAILQLWLSLELEKLSLSRGLEGVRSLRQLLTIALNTRAFAYAVSQPKASSMDFIITGALRTTTAPHAFSNSMQFTALLFLVSFGRQTAERLWGHLVSVARITHADFVGPLLEKKVQIGAICLLGLPLSTWSVLVASLVEGSTLTPLFTLPLFILGFPRPMSFWKRTWFRRQRREELLNGGLDEAIYAAVSPALLKEFITAATNLGIPLAPRDSFVARHEDRLLFLRVVGSGWNFMYVVVKGLELEEQTSCHHQESAWMDEIFERDLRAECPLGRRACKTKLTVVQPLLQLRVPAFSDAKARIPSLCSAQEKAVLERMFFRAFSYLWIKGKPAFKGEAYWTPQPTPPINPQSEGDDGFESGVEQIGWRRRESLQPSAEMPDWRSKWIEKCVGGSIPSKAVMERMRKLTQSIWTLVHGQREFGDIDLCRYFENDFLLQETLRLKALESDNLIHVTKKAFRYACKLALDEIYEMGPSEAKGNVDVEETFTELSLYEKAFTFCSPAETPACVRAEATEGKRILSMTKQEDGMGQMRIFTYDATGLRFHVGRLDKGVVEGVWTNLSLELLYLTSDDDERFSIQHDRHLMRNLLTECADSPLGYPVHEATFRVDLFRNFSVAKM